MHACCVTLKHYINVFELFLEKILDEIMQDFNEFEFTKKESLSYDSKEM